MSGGDRCIQFNYLLEYPSPEEGVAVRYLIRSAGRGEEGLGEEQRERGRQIIFFPYSDGVRWNLADFGVKRVMVHDPVDRLYRRIILMSLLILLIY